MSEVKMGLGDNLRIVWAIAAKDIVDAIRNRTTIGLLIAVTLITLQGRALPFLLGLSGRLPLVVYDQGHSQLVESLRTDDRVGLSRADSQEAMEAQLAGTGTSALGLVLPGDLDQRLQAGEGIVLDGYYPWGGRSAVQDLRSQAEQLLGELAGRPVHIDVEGHVVYPAAGAPSGLVMISLTLLVIVMMTGSFLVPYLMFEEKETKTMAVLLVSPASVSQVVIGKALAGSFYCLTAVAAALAFNRVLVVHWEIAVLATLAGTLFAVSLGLLLGTLFENPQQMSLWAAAPLLVLVLPVLVVDMDVSLPAGLGALLPWLPTLALDRAYRLSFAGAVPTGQTLAALGIILAWSVPVLAGVVAIVRRSDR